MKSRIIMGYIFLATGLAYTIKFSFMSANPTQVYFGITCWIIGFELSRV